MILKGREWDEVGLFEQPQGEAQHMIRLCISLYSEVVSRSYHEILNLGLEELSKVSSTDRT